MSVNGTISATVRIGDLADRLAEDGEAVAELFNEIGKRLSAVADAARIFRTDFRNSLSDHGRCVVRLAGGK